jgi:drug/metabolite transporter (DMT)-like permease
MVVPLMNTYPLFVVAISYTAVHHLLRSPRVIGGIASIVVGVLLIQIA